ncbi:MAG TPA: tyrosine-type recombinase/integrase, partial [Balneolaceae bacterium]|nr:tyrosine-type recombinase/integrase [Balneolaceae bacterium]
GHDPEVLKFTEVTPGLIEGFQDWMQDEKGNKGATIRKNRSDVRRILKLAEKHKLIFDDPFEGVKPPKKEKPKPKVKLTYQQIQAIQKLSLKEGSYEYHAQNAFILAFYLNGLRFGDVAKMKWDQINNGRLEYRMSKSVKPVYIKIPEAAQQFLSRYRDKGGVYVFPFLEGLPKQDKDTIETRISGELAKVNEAIKEVAKQAGIKESVADQVSTHVARHSLAMYLVNEEYSIYDVSKALRHSSVTTTENYLDRLGLQAKDQTVESPFS